MGHFVILDFRLINSYYVYVKLYFQCIFIQLPNRVVELVLPLELFLPLISFSPLVALSAWNQRSFADPQFLK